MPLRGGARVLHLGSSTYCLPPLSGFSVSGAGDVNGDGLAELIVGALGGNSYAGESYVVFGKAGTAAVNLSDVAAGTGRPLAWSRGKGFE